MSKELATKIFKDSLEASMPESFMKKLCRLDGDILTLNKSVYDLSLYENIYVFGSGKAAYTMAKEMELLLGDRIHNGLIITPTVTEKLQKITVKEGSHPLPSALSISSAKALVEMMQECSEKDLYIFVLSGGSSALMEIPIEPITLDELQEMTRVMLANNLEIHEINTIRKHLSEIKGGRLASMCKAQGAVLVLSDIIDNDFGSIGSAPLYADASSFKDAQKILESKNLLESIPLSVAQTIQKGVRGEIKESPFTPLERVEHILLASNAQALEAAYESALSHGLRVKKVLEPMEGEVSFMVAKMLEMSETSTEECLLFGGECTVDLKGNGRGGRNQHAVLLMLEKICQSKSNLTFLSASTDGVDGNSDATGAVISYDDCKKSHIDRAKYIEEYESYHYLKEIDALLYTGETGTNVIDVAILIKGDSDG